MTILQIYSGFITVNASTDSHIFSWFFPATVSFESTSIWDTLYKAKNIADKLNSYRKLILPKPQW